jgi:hypothetical protein
VNTIVVAVNNVSVPENPSNGWQYNATNNSIQFFGNAVPPQGASIFVNFVPTTGHNG